MKVLKFPRVPVPKPGRPHSLKNGVLPRKAKHKVKPTAEDEAADRVIEGVALMLFPDCSNF